MKVANVQKYIPQKEEKIDTVENIQTEEAQEFN